VSVGPVAATGQDILLREQQDEQILRDSDQIELISMHHAIILNDNSSMAAACRGGTI